MVKTLVLFLFSDNVDTYINAIAYTYDKMDVKAVRLVYVKGTKIGLKDDTPSTVVNGIWNRLQSLALGSSEIYKQLNERLLDRHLIPIDYPELKRDLGDFIKRQGGARNCIIDLTGASKAASIDIFAVCLALGVKSVYTFELDQKRDPKAPEESLYHALLSKGAYSYTCLTSTPPVKASQSSLLRKSYVLWYVGLASLIIMVVSLYILSTIGPNSPFVQFLNLTAAVVSLAAPALALIEQRRET